MEEQKKPVGVLLGDDGTTINLTFGSNQIGRAHLSGSDKKVSRHHGNYQSNIMSRYSFHYDKKIFFQK